MDVLGILSFTAVLWLSVAPASVRDAQAPLTSSRTKMLVEDQIHVVDGHRTIELLCEFYMDQFDLFHNPVIWTKIQMGEKSHINIMGNIQEPFVETGRFKVELLQSDPRFRLTLFIDDARLEDYGNYSCEVRGKEAIVLASVTHYVFVRAPVRSIWLSDKGPTEDGDLGHATDLHLTLTEDRPSPIYCVSIGGCPPPDMNLYLGQNDVTGMYSLKYSSELSGERGFRQVLYRTERWTDRFTVQAENDDNDLQCIVTVPGLGSSIASVRLRIRYAPVVQCDDAEAVVGQENVYIRCQVRSRPGMNSLFWIVDLNGTTVASGESRNEYQTVNRDRGDNSIETWLYIKQVYEGSFREYTVVAENGIGKTVHQTRLLKELKPPSHQSVMQIIEPKPSRDESRDRTRPTSRSSTASLPRHLETTLVIIASMCLCILHVFHLCS